MIPIKSLLIGIVLFVIIYLCASFFEVSFDIRQWSDGTRAITANVGGMCLCISYVLGLLIKYN